MGIHNPPPTPSALSILGYSRYTALVSQVGAAAPTATVLVNELTGVPVWSRIAVGVYWVRLVGAFLASKTFYVVTSNRTHPIVAGGNWRLFTLDRLDNDTLELVTFDSDVSIPSWTLTDTLLLDTPVEIRIYP